MQKLVHLVWSRNIRIVFLVMTIIFIHYYNIHYHNIHMFAQVFLGPNGEVEEYSVISIQRNAAISLDLILDQKEEHLFIMTPNMVTLKAKDESFRLLFLPQFSLFHSGPL